jgi:hypothetical protein
LVVLNRADTPIEAAVEAFAEFGVEAAYVVPLQNGLDKSILDATQTVREFLSLHGIHDYGTQDQGPEGKRTIPIHVIHPDRFETRTVSLYRPLTKDGDPRLWISVLGNYAKSENLIALIADGKKELYAVNCSDTALLESRHIDGSPLRTLLTDKQVASSAVELLGLLREIAGRGYLDSLRSGDTGVGYTLETLLGIEANSRPAPDYMGIELKASRLRADGRRNRSNLFSKKPDWDLKGLGSARAVLDAFGWNEPTTGRLQLYSTVTANPNPSGLYLSTDEKDDVVTNYSISEHEQPPQFVAQWNLSVLQASLAAKHPETFWVSARVQTSPNGVEQFHYVKVIHTRTPLISNFGPLVDAARISMDYTLSLEESGRTRDHGYLWKIGSAHHRLLFPDPVEYDLLAA